ncbi:MAG: DNA mismatch repair protein MutL [Flavobacterium sp. BFFFF2]|nr:MAG: DNA mismatch repair protein MutL [Flavobacterium sp. BFFFF2]
MSTIIQRLPDHVANQIAAGEVVQRPASVVKELMENAVDAGATSISLLIKEAGKVLIQVVDNGCGMNQADALLCFERHATSKIRKAEDLFDLHTKGFRGEALASIAAVAHVELKTRQAEDELGTHLVIEGSKQVSLEPAVVPKGTTFSVKNLFFNIPARRNFLKSDTVEFRHIVDEFLRIALAHPNIQFHFYHNGSDVFNAPASNLRQRIATLFSGKANEKLVPLNEDTELVTLSGFVGKPDFAKKNKSEQFFFVNDRFIKSPYLHHAVLSAFEGLLRDGFQPVYFLYLQVPPQHLDINIHPTKTEIKFDNEQALYAILRAAIKHSLGQFQVAPILDFERDPNLDTPYHFQQKEAVVPQVQVDRDFNPFKSMNAPEPTRQRNSPLPYLAAENNPKWESLYVGLQSADEHSWESEPEQATLFASDDQHATASVTFQLQRKYIVSTLKSGLLVIHQQRAHQRVLYEGFLTGMTHHQAMSQPLLFPLKLTFSGQEILMLQQISPILTGMGFGFESIENNAVSVNALPVEVSASEVQHIMEALLHDIEQGLPETGYSQNDALARSLAKNISIKTGAVLTTMEQESLVNNLFACKEADRSPFGEPTYFIHQIEDIDKKFHL